jgi:hypothetical protein
MSTIDGILNPTVVSQEEPGKFVAQFSSAPYCGFIDVIAFVSDPSQNFERKSVKSVPVGCVDASFTGEYTDEGRISYHLCDATNYTNVQIFIGTKTGAFPLYDYLTVSLEVDFFIIFLQ